MDNNTIVRCIIKFSICLKEDIQNKTLQLHFDNTCLNESPMYGTLDVTENICIPNNDQPDCNIYCFCCTSCLNIEDVDGEGLLCFLYPLSACNVYIYKGVSVSECAVHVGGYVVDYV